MSKSRHRYKGFLASILMIVIVLLLLPYTRYTSYQKQTYEPFHGDSWYNPYADLGDTLLRANFHAHSRSWGGLTWGENSDEEVIAAYVDSGYQVPSLSNYFRVTPAEKFPGPSVYIPVYEHGLNVKKVHCLCIGAHAVSTWEYPLHLSSDQTNAVISSLRSHCDLVALAHPGARHAHTPDDMNSLSGMQLLEVANTQGARTAYWDSVLSAGRAIWLLANDDMHSLDDPEAFMRWNMIYAKRPDRGAVIDALRNGHHYGVLRYNGVCEDNRLAEVEINNDTLRIATKDTFNRLDVYGQKGATLFYKEKSAFAEYPLQGDETYMRVEIHHDHCVMYLNPLIRYDGKTVPLEFAMAPENSLLTWLIRVLVSALIFAVIVFWYRRVVRHRA